MTYYKATVHVLLAAPSRADAHRDLQHHLKHLAAWEFPEGDGPHVQRVGTYDEQWPDLDGVNNA